MGRYKKGGAETRMSSEGYLSNLDTKLGLPIGTIYGLCRAAVNSKTIERDECKVTYKGLTKAMRGRAHHYGLVTKEIFLIEGRETDRGRKVLAQVFLNMP